MKKKNAVKLVFLVLICFGIFALSGCESAEDRLKKEVDAAYAQVGTIYFSDESKLSSEELIRLNELKRQKEKAYQDNDVSALERIKSDWHEFRNLIQARIDEIEAPVPEQTQLDSDSQYGSLTPEIAKAYLELMNSANLINGITETKRRPVAIYDLNGDGIHELMYFETEESDSQWSTNADYLKVFTYSNGRVSQTAKIECYGSEKFFAVKNGLLVLKSAEGPYYRGAGDYYKSETYYVHTFDSSDTMADPIRFAKWQEYFEENLVFESYYTDELPPSTDGAAYEQNLLESIESALFAYGDAPFVYQVSARYPYAALSHAYALEILNAAVYGGKAEKVISHWQTAYLEVLQSQANVGSSAGNSKPVAIYDLCGDSTPELLYFQKSLRSDLTYLQIWTYINHAAVQIASIELWGAGWGPYFPVFALRDKRLCVEMRNGDEYDSGVRNDFYNYTLYSPGSNGLLEATDFFRKTVETHYDGRNSYQIIVSCYINGEDTAERDYNRLEQDMLSKIEALLLMDSYENTAADYISQSQYPFEGMSYEDAVKFLYADMGSDASSGIASSNESEYILPHSDTRALTDEDLRSLTKEELRLARNEIYARYGRQFGDKDLQAYFDSKSWYTALRKLPPGTDPALTALEQSNIGVIQNYESGS